MGDSKPGPEHAIFKKDVGEWDADVEVFAPVHAKSKGRMTSRLTCGGLWLVSDYDGGGFVGHGMWTWDASKKMYVGVWADSMITFLAPGEGTWDAGKKTMTFRYQAEVGGRPVKWRQTTTTIDANTLVFRSFVPDDAASETMKVTYRRRATIPAAKWS
ncbi:MAG TPA: DUF1579 family protein [Myxococcota bacterium]